MKPALKNSISLFAGIFVGSIVNYGLIIIGSILIAPPAGVDVMDADSFAANIHLFTPIHFLSPFLAHALGTFAGALATYKVAASHKKMWALAIGGVFLAGGIASTFMIPAPVWFIALDLILAYIPMAWLAGTLLERRATEPR